MLYIVYVEVLGCPSLGKAATASRFATRSQPQYHLILKEKNGNVSYYVKACLVYPDGREPDELEEAFEVVVPLDMNMNPAMRQPICMEFEEIASSLCCGSGPLSVQVRLPATGYCPGQSIPVEINANNQSSVEVHSIKLELVRRGAYHSTSPQSDQYLPPESLERHLLGAILPHTKRVISTELVVPDMIAPVLEDCRIIDVEFYFKVKLKMSGCNDDLEDEAQIYLGLVPIAELVDGEYKHPMEYDLPSGPIPNLNDPPQFIQPYIYPSVTVQNGLQAALVQNSNYPGSNAYPGHPGAGYPAHIRPGNTIPAPNPGVTTAYPGPNPPYPGNASNLPYPNANTPYPGANTPYPGINPSTSPGAPYPTNPSPVAPSPVGFRIPETSPGYPMGSVTSPYNPNAPSAPTI